MTAPGSTSPPRFGGDWALASVGVALAAGVVRTLVVARCLDPAETGLMGIALLAMGFIEAVASTGVDTALVALRNPVEDYLDPAFTIQLVRGVLVTLLLWCAAPALGLLFHNPAALPVIRAVGSVALLRGLANPAVSVAVRRLEFRRVFWWSLPEVLGTLGISVGLALWRRDVWALVIGGVAGQAIGSAASYGLLPRMPRLALGRERIVELLRFGGLVSGSRALMYFCVNLDFAYIGISLGTAALGLYQFATRIAELPIVTVTKAMSQVALPALSGLQGNTRALTRTWQRMLAWVFAANAAAALLILCFAGSAIPWLVGSRWVPAVPLMRILALAMVFRAVIILTGQLLDALGRPGLTLRLNAARLAVLVLLMPPLGIWKGGNGIALAVLGASGVGALLALRISGRLLAGWSGELRVQPAAAEVSGVEHDELVP